MENLAGFFEGCQGLTEHLEVKKAMDLQPVAWSQVWEPSRLWLMPVARTIMGLPVLACEVGHHPAFSSSLTNLVFIACFTLIKN